MNISYLFKYLWKRKWLIAIPTLIAIVVAWWLCRHQAAEYTSTAELSTGYMEVNPLNYNNRSQNNTVLFNNVIQTLKSNQVLDQVSYNLLLHDLQGTNQFISRKSSNIGEIIAAYPGGKKALLTSLSNKRDSFYVLNLAQRTDRIIRRVSDGYGYSPDALLSKIHINRVENSDFIMVTTTANDPSLSAFISNEVCRSFLALYQDKLGRASSTSLDSLRSLMETKKQILDNKLQLVQGDGDLTLTGSMGMLSTLQGQLTQQKSNLIAAQVALENVNTQIKNAGAQGGIANNEDIIALRTNIDNLYAKYVNGGSSDANLLHQIDKLRNTLQQKLSSIGGSVAGVPLGDLNKQKMDLDVKINVAKQTMKDLQEKINVLQGALQSSAAKQGLEQGIQSDVAIARQQYEDANRMLNEALNRNMFPGNDFKQVLQASPPLHPSPSKKGQIIGFAGTGVFFFVVFLLLFFEFIDPSIKTPSYLKANIPLPLLANLEYINNMQNDSLEEIFKATAPISKYRSRFREQIKQLRFEITHSEERMFLIAGYHSKSGRTTIIDCLARSLSLSGNTVLMVDANFHNNTLTQKYNASTSLETIEAKGDPSSINKLILNSTVPAKDERIRIIGCGNGNYTPSEVLPQNNLFIGLKQNKDYDYILVDCASLSSGPDCKELLQYIDAVILAFSADQSLTEEDRKFIHFLEMNNIKTLGAVLNKVPEYSMDI